MSTPQVGGSFESQATQSYNSFSGSDIRAVIGTTPFANIQAISYSVTREKAPIYTMGSPDVRSYSRNKRGIAGSLIWINFDRHSLLDIVRQEGGKFVANVDDVRPQYSASTSQVMNQTAIFNSSLVRDSGVPVTATIDQTSVQLSSVSGFKELATPWYSDQILPFDVTICGSNENGAACAMKIFAVEILNEGSGVSIDDSVTEMQATFVARSLEPWQAVASAFQNTVGGGLNPAQ